MRSVSDHTGTRRAVRAVTGAASPHGRNFTGTFFASKNKLGQNSG